MKKAILMLICLMLLCPNLALAAKTADEGDITASCEVQVSEDKDHRKHMIQGEYTSYWTGKPGATVTVRSKAQMIQGVSLSFHMTACQLTIEDTDSGEVIGEYTESFENIYIPFSRPVQAFRIVNNDAESVQISKLQAVAEGELPSWVQCWERMQGSADLMLVSTHPDDELLWFGGILPYYAGEIKKKVIVVYMVGGNSPKRKNELLDGLWTCGVRYYPQIGCFPDKGASSMQSTIRNWGEGAAQQRITEMIRKWKPLVVITQDIKGEYGHFHHIATVQATIEAVESLSGDASFDTASAEQYGVWTPKKLYLHMFKQNAITFDWRQPLEAFNGETALAIAKKAFKMHVSQQSGRYSVSDSGKLDCRIFGLYFSQVGDDVELNDLFEHISTEER